MFLLIEKSRKLNTSFLKIVAFILNFYNVFQQTLMLLFQFYQFFFLVTFKLLNISQTPLCDFIIGVQFL